MGGIRRWYILALVAVAILLPLASGDRYFLTLLNLVLINAVLALGFYIIFGLTGIFSVAQAAFWGVGAYTAAILTVDHGFPVWASFLLAPIVAAAFGVLLGAPTLRLKTHYLTMATIGFAEVVRQILINWEPVTKGPSGISGIPSPHLGSFRFNSPLRYYYLALIITALVVVVILRLRSSRLGRGMESIRDDDLAAEAMGVNVTGLKILAFALSAACAGLAGAMYSHFVRYISPDVFHLEAAVQVLAMVLIGGRVYVVGAVVGAIVVTLLPEALRTIKDWWAIVYALAILGFLAFMPQGLTGFALQLRDRWLQPRRPPEGSAE
jgi:branched-chain amino acid transport system permease protein